MNNFNDKDMVAFAKYAKNYQSPKDLEEALVKFQLLNKFSENGIICKTGDLFARVKPDGKCHSIYQMCWTFRTSDRKGVAGKYLPSAYNMLRFYMRTPMKDATSYDAQVHEWTVAMFMQALRYIPTSENNEGWKDHLHRVTGWDSKANQYAWDPDPLPVEFYRDKD